MPRYVRVVPAACIGILLIFTFRLYAFSYFWLDDFNNLYWVQQYTPAEMLRQLLSPSPEYFRPSGMLFYWLGLRVFDRDPLPYHLVMWALHTLNVGLVYVLLKRFTASRAGSVMGALLYAAPPVFNDIFWSFGTIFELVGAALFFTGMLLWQRKDRTLAVVAGSVILLFFGLKAKEMVITLPAIWLLQDLLLRRPLKLKGVSVVMLPGLLGAWFGLQKVLTMRGSDPGDPYFMDLQGIVMGRGFGYYFNELFGTNIRWQLWSIGFVAGMLILLALRWRLAAFFQAYVFVTFLPLIFLVNHRGAFYWYFPMLGVCGLAAVLTRSAASAVTSRIPPERIAPYACALFAVLCGGMYFYSSTVTEPYRLWQQDISNEYQAFVEDLRALPPPQPGETLYFKSVPRYFGTDVLKSSAQVALRRLDVDAKLVEEFPPEARYRLRFENSRIVEEQ